MFVRVYIFFSSSRFFHNDKQQAQKNTILQATRDLEILPNFSLQGIHNKPYLVLCFSLSLSFAIIAAPYPHKEDCYRDRKKTAILLCGLVGTWVLSLVSNIRSETRLSNSEKRIPRDCHRPTKQRMSKRLLVRARITCSDVNRREKRERGMGLFFLSLLCSVTTTTASRRIRLTIDIGLWYFSVSSYSVIIASIDTIVLLTIHVDKSDIVPIQWATRRVRCRLLMWAALCMCARDDIINPLLLAIRVQCVAFDFSFSLLDQWLLYDPRVESVMYCCMPNVAEMIKLLFLEIY